MQFDDRQDEEPLRLHQELSSTSTMHLTSHKIQVSCVILQKMVQQNSRPLASDGSSSGSGIGEAIVDVLLQPNVAPVSSGSGGGASGGWRDDDDDDEKNKHSYKPRKRGR